MTLYHYTCDHGHAEIGGGGIVIPGTYQSRKLIGTPSEYAWFTDLATPIRDALGLTSQILSCDRTRHRYRVVNEAGIFPWIEARRTYTWGQELESAPGARPRHWWVSTEPVEVVYDPIGKAAA